MYGNPESGAESLTRIAGAGLAIAGALTLYGLYGVSNPTNWLANLNIAVGDGSFRTLSAVGAGGVAVGGALYLRKGLWLITAGLLVTLAVAGHKMGWYTFGKGANPYVQVEQVQTQKAPSQNYQYYNKPQAQQSQVGGISLIDTGIKLTPAQAADCANDEDNDGILNRDESPLWKQNCSTGTIWKKP